MTIDNEFKFHTHTAAATKKSNQILGLIKKSYKTRDPTTITTLYKAMVRPHLEYGNSIWGPFYQLDIKKIERVQRRATKLISSIKDFPYEERLRILKLPSMVYRRKRGDMILMFKIMNKLVHVDENKLFERARMQSTRGHHLKVAKGPATKFARVNAFSQRTVNTWNKLPESVIEAPTVNAFKNRLDKYWDDVQFLSPF